MNTEQLKMVMDMLSTMGAASKDAFIWWLVLDKVLPLIGWLATVGAVTYLITNGVRMASNIDKFEELRDVLGVGSPGHMMPSEATATLNAALKLARESKK